MRALIHRASEREIRTAAPGFVGGVGARTGNVAGTCFQVAPGVFATSWRTAQAAEADEVGSYVRIEPASSPGAGFEGRLERVDSACDLAIIRASEAFEDSVGAFARSDDVAVNTDVVVTGVTSEGPGLRYVDAHGTWQGWATRRQAVPLGRVGGFHIVPGMLGAPVRRASDGTVIGVLIQDSAQGGSAAFSVWVARTEDLVALLEGVAPVEFSEPKPPARSEGVRLFYSYSHRDERYRAQLETHLALLRRQGIIREWHDRKIGAGDEWRRTIRRELSRADVILLLVSPDFMASDFAYLEEMEVAMRRHEAGSARVIPVIVRPVDWHLAPFATLQALPTDGKPITLWKNRDLAWRDVAQGVRSAVSELSP